MGTLKCEYWFPIPIWVGTVPGIEESNIKEAIKYCNDLQRRDKGRVVSNVGGWQSKELFFNDVKNTPLKKYFECIDPIVKECLLELGSNEDLIIDRAWVNINKKGDSNGNHTHSHSILSGVFYLSDNNSKIIFNKTADINSYSQELINSNNSTYLSFLSAEYAPVKNSLLIFPSWLNHSAEKNDNNYDRISIAFNTKLLSEKIQ
jgi:uncharacterized protein (TIGR02466 family)